MKKTKCTGSIVFILLCIFFAVGILLGSVYANIFGSEAGLIKALSLRETLPQSLPFYSLFIKNAKFFIISLLLCFLSFGIPIITANCMLNGFFYGCAVSYIMRLKSAYALKAVLFSIIPFCILKTLPLLLSSCFSCWRITGTFLSRHGKKSCLKREKNKNITEFAIVFILSCLIIFIACRVEESLALTLPELNI